MTDLDTPDTTRRLDWRAIGQAALSGVMILLPLAILNKWLGGNEDDNRQLIGLIFTLLILATGAVVGFSAGATARHRERVHGAIAAAIAYGIVQFGGIVRRLVTGEPVANPIGFAYLALLMATMGMLGASLAQRTHYVRS